MRFVLVRRVRALAAAVLLLVVVACIERDARLPKVRIDATPEPCGMPAPPPPIVVKRGADPTRCFPQSLRDQGLDVWVRVSVDGRAAEVTRVLLACTPDWRHSMVPATDTQKRCVLEHLRDWHFVSVETCWPVFAQVSTGCPGFIWDIAAGAAQQRAEPDEARRTL
jgi:hypothetical protein